MTKTHTITVTAGDIEAWTTGDADFSDSYLLDALNAAQELVSLGGEKFVEVTIIIVE